MENKSEVARLLAQITAQYEAAKAALNGPAVTARHDFITKRMEIIGESFEELTVATGSKEEAMVIMAKVLDMLPEAGGQPNAQL